MNKAEAGNRIRIARLRKGLTQTALAEKLGVTQGAVNSWENGLTFPKVSNLVPLAEILEIPVEELLKVG